MKPVMNLSNLMKGENDMKEKDPFTVGLLLLVLFFWIFSPLLGSG